MSKIIKEKPSNIINLKDYIPDIHIRMDYGTTYNFTGNIVPGYNSPKALVTVNAAQALKEVQQNLVKKQMSLIIFDAYRPYTSVMFFYKDWLKQEDHPALKKKYYPYKTKQQILDEGFISKKSSHCRCSTVDLSIINTKTNELLNMGTIFDYFDEKSFTNNNDFSEEVIKNRLCLKETLESAGFKNYEKEWWHFRYLACPNDPHILYDFLIN